MLSPTGLGERREALRAGRFTHQLLQSWDPDQLVCLGQLLRVLAGHVNHEAVVVLVSVRAVVADLGDCSIRALELICG